MKGRPPEDFAWIRLDTNNNCNVHCVYCHNARSDGTVSIDDFNGFLRSNITSVNNFQVGCRMEPTLDLRMADFMMMVADSPAKPKQQFRLQTNGILLHRHDIGKIRDSGLTNLSVSVDAADSSVHKSLRGGTSLPKVERNLREFRQACPNVNVEILTTVTSANINQLDSLIELGIDIGVNGFSFRQMFYYPGNKVVDGARMLELLVSAEAFSAMKQRVSARFEDRINLRFYENDALVTQAIAIKKTSLIDEKHELVT
jgi:MoaA/NifB/PqqE/SkfB family radical SAM enzyme